jgi:hypothetical protein
MFSGSGHRIIIKVEISSIRIRVGSWSHAHKKFSSFLRSQLHILGEFIQF